MLLSLSLKLLFFAVGKLSNKKPGEQQRTMAIYDLQQRKSIPKLFGYNSKSKLEKAWCVEL